MTYDYLNDQRQERGNRGGKGAGLMNPRLKNSESPEQIIAADLNEFSNLRGYPSSQDLLPRVGLGFDSKQRQRIRGQSGLESARPAGTKSGLIAAIERPQPKSYQPRIVQGVNLPPIQFNDFRPQFEPIELNANSAGLQKVLDFQGKVREMEVGLSDTRADVELKLQVIKETLASKIDFAIQKLDEQQSSHQQQQNQNQKLQADALSKFSSQLNAQIDQITQTVSLLQSKQEEVDLKVNQQIRTYDKFSETYTTQIQQPQTGNQIEKINLFEVESELKTLRGYLNEERKQREQLTVETSQIMNYLQTQVHNQEQTIIQRLRQAREDSIQVMVTSVDEKTQSEGNTRAGYEQQYHLVNLQIQSLDKKVEDEISFRLKAEQDLKGWLDQRFSLFKAAQQQDEAAQMDREKRLMHQLQQGLGSISEIIKAVKEQHNSSMKEISEVTYESIQSALQRINTVQDNVEAHNQVVEQAVQDCQLKVDTLQEQALKHGRLINETVAKEVARTEKIMAIMDVFVKSSFAELKKENQQTFIENQSWQVNFEDMQARKIMEMQNAIKVLNQNFLYMQKDSTDKFEIVEQQHKSQYSVLTTQIKDLKGQLNSNVMSPLVLPDSETSNTQRQQQLPQQNHQLSKEYSLEELENRLEKLQQTVLIKAGDIALRQAHRVMQDKIESETLLEGRAAAFSVEIESKILQKVQIFKAEMIRMQEEHDQNSDKLITKMERTLKTFDDEYQQKYIQAQMREDELRLKVSDIVLHECSLLKLQFNEQMAQNEEMLIRLQIKNPQGVSQDNHTDINALRAKTQTDYVNTVVKTSYLQITGEMKQLMRDQEMRILKKLPTKFDPTYLEESIDLYKNQFGQKISKLEADTQQLKSHYGQLDSQLTVLDANVLRQSQEVQHLNSLNVQETKRLSDESKKHTEDIAAFKNRFQITEQAVQKQDHRLQVLEQEHQASDLQKQVQNLQQELQQVRGNFDKVIEPRLAGIEKQQQSVIKDIAEIKPVSLQASNEMNDVKKQLLEYHSEQSVHTTQLADLTKKANEHSHNLENVDQTITKLITTDDKIQKELNSFKNQVNQNEAAENRNDSQLSTKVEQISAQMQTLEKANSDQDKRISTVVNEVSGVSKEVQQVTKSVTELDTKVKALKPVAGEAAAKPASNEDIQYIKTKVDHVATENDSLKKQITDQKAYIDKKLQDMEGLNRSQLKGELLDIHEQLKRHQDELLQLSHQCAEEKVSIDGLTESLNEIRKLIR